jgi:Flp pilus assembly protein TadD
MQYVGSALAGVELCREGEWQQGLEVLGRVVEGNLEDRRLRALSLSYLGYGLARFQQRKKEGLALCEEAVRLELCEPEVLLNLVRIQLLTNDRRGAVRTVQRGLELHPDHPVLVHYCRQFGIRQRPVLPFLHRANALNRFFGALRSLLRKTGNSRLRSGYAP